MFKLQRPTNRPSKPRERVDFKFSNFQALQVPKGWDRLFVSLISVETGKTMAKLGKAIVRNGSCQWTETLSESIYLSRDDSSKVYEECLVKLVVSTSSTRSSTLGEATINVAHYTSSRVSAAVSQPLKKCSYGTILQVKIQCLTPRSKTGDEESKNSNSQEKYRNVALHDTDSKSYRSDNSSDSTVGPPREDLATNSRPLKLDSKEASQSASGTIESFDSLEGSIGRENLSIKNALKSEEYNSHERQVGGSYDSSPIPDFYSVDKDSPSKQSSLNFRLYRREDFQNEAAVNGSSTTNVGSSKNLLEAAEDTIEELRAEAKMWERNARKLMIDLDILRKEFSDLSKKQAELVMELSAAYAEHDGLKREVEKLKLELQKLTTNQATQEDSIIQSESLVQIKKVLENEIKYQQELNDNLGQQLKRSQESNIELVSVLQELEETIEQQKIEIENLSSLKFDSTDLENSIARNSEDNRTLLLQLQQLQESEKKLQADVQLLEEALRDKTDELENERNSNSQILLHVEEDFKYKLSAKEEEIASLEATLSGYAKGEHFEILDDNNENNVDLIREIESLREKVQELEKDCAELTDENLELLLKLKDSNNTDIRKCASFDSMSSEHPTVCPSDESEVSDPKFQISHLEDDLKKKSSEEVQNAGFGSSEHFIEISKQLDKTFQLLMKPWCGVSSDESETCNDFFHGLMIASKGNTTTTNMSAEYILSFLQELNRLLETRITESDEILRNYEIEIKERNDIIADAKKKIEDSILEVQELEISKAESEENYANVMKELDQKRSEVDLIEANLLSKEQETNFLLQRQRELEAEVPKLQQKKSHLEQNMELALRERNISSTCMENLQNDLTALRDTVSSHVSANANLERNLEVLERKRHELEDTLSGLQEENMQLQECISGLETQVRQLKDEKEFYLQETDNFKSVAMSLQDEIQKLKIEMGIQILDLKQKSEDTQKQLLGAQEECEYLKEENKTLQASAESFAQESMKLQNSNSELKRVNQELHENCSALMAQLSESKKSLSHCTKKVELLEDHLTSVQDDFALRENTLKSEVDALVKENSYQKEKLALEESLHQMLLEKTTEFESLQKEVEHLCRQLSDAHKEIERISFEASSEVSRLLADKSELQASLQEVQSELTVNKHNAALQESELKVQDLTGQLAASKQSHERLMADHERILKLLANYKKSEEKLKTDLNDLELKHTISDYECQQLTKEMGILKAQLQNISGLQDEISILKSELKGCRLDKGKLEFALQTVYGDYEELKAENISFSEKISILQDAMSEFEECKRNKIALEEKLLQMEKELTAKEIICIQNADLKNELTEVKRANMQFQKKMYRLEEEKVECLKKAQALEEDLKLMEERNNIHKEGAYNHDFHDQSPLALSVDHMTNTQLLENEVDEGLDANNKNRVLHERYERTKSSLETELRDLRERYLEMSLKYAEVESQREDLVMKLRATRRGKRWFS
ncbi:hypothetical protein Pfo_029789 [Paulownia fortunei]|nr:hypothetical protein Pfo_029789 [Paulownia fortunei]